MKLRGVTIIIMLVIMACAFSCKTKTQEMQNDRPNILFAIADDWSWPQTKSDNYGFINTPNFDNVVQEGVIFTNAYVTSPSCTPSRGSILTGQWHWRLEQGANLWSTLDPKFKVYPDILEKGGYFVGYTGKGWGPGDWKVSGRTRNPAGPEYNKIRLKPPTTGISNVDYAKNFEEFLKEKPAGKPFCFWYGAFEPHRIYELGSGLKEGKKLSDVTVPSCLPDVTDVQSDLLDYAVEVEWFDKQLGLMIRKLKDLGLFENTIIVVTGDNGLPFPRCKSNIYEMGTHVPLAIEWPARMKQNRSIEDFVSLEDLAPTFLAAAGITPPKAMTGRSIMNLILSNKSGKIDTTRNFVLTGKERHTPAQADLKTGYPMRAIRTSKYLYIRNFTPERWPAGIENHPVLPFYDIDGSPTKTYMMDHRNDPDCKHLFELSFDKRPMEELYDLMKDPGELVNVADDSRYASIKKDLSDRLMKELKETKDPRVIGGEEKFDEYPYYGPMKLQNRKAVLK